MERSRYSALIRRSSVVVFGLLIAAGALLYAISPRRDPAFTPTSSNAGSPVPWAAALPEPVWTWAATLLAVALAGHIVLLALDRPAARRMLVGRGASTIVSRLATVAVALAAAAGLAYTLWFGMLWYLLTQSIVD
jgi:hypothetical protein